MLSKERHQTVTGPVNLGARVHDFLELSLVDILHVSNPLLQVIVKIIGPYLDGFHGSNSKLWRQTK